MISEFCICRPVATLLMSFALVLGGLFAYKFLPVAALPSAEFPVVNVSASLPGASPETMATSVATPLIKQFATIAGIDSISTTNSLGSTSIAIQFVLNRDIDAAAADVQAAIARTQRQLPPEMTSPPSYRKVNPADAPILLMSLVSDTVPLTDLDAFAENVISPSLSTIEGVAQVSIFGQQKYAVRVQIDPTALAARGISIDQLQTAIASANSNTPLGVLQNDKQQLTITANTQLNNAAGFSNIIIATRNGRPVRLGEVTRVKAMLPSFQDQMPAAASIQLLNDRSTSIREAVDDVQFTLLLTIALVVMVIFLFLRRVTATIIPAVAVPISLIATLGAMFLFGFSIDNISLMGLTMAVGLVVDDAIVMLENIFRHMEEDGLSAPDAALKGAREIGFTNFDLDLAGGGVHPRAFDGRSDRPHFQRVRGGGDSRHPGVDVRVADTDADAVLAAFIGVEGRARSSAGRRSQAQFLRARLWLAADLLPAVQFPGFSRLYRNGRTVGLADPDLAEGLLPAGGYRPDFGDDHRAPGHFVRRHGEAAGASG